jgi:two-component system sensor histidine kinase CpxA
MLVNFQMREAVRAWERGGRAGLAEAMERFTAHGQTRACLTDAQGRDLLSGEDRSGLLDSVRRRPTLVMPHHGHMVMARASEDGRYWYFLMVQRRRWVVWFLHPEYLWVLGPVVGLCYLLARHLTAPLRRLRKAMQRFGQGDLSARAASDRKDELGELSQAFDQMAGRIETLLTAERRLLGDISHELRSPLTRLSLAVELARSGEDREAALNRVQKEADRLNALVGELLQVTRAEGDSATLVKNPLALDELVREIVEDSRLEAEARGVTLALDAAPGITLQGDAELLRRAVENVLRNAIRFAPRDTAVELSVEARPAAALVRVRDYGPGVPEEALGRIFDAFYRVETHRDRMSGGVGLGLSIARRAVELHGGRVRARNAGPGLAVEIELPLG